MEQSNGEPQTERVEQSATEWGQPAQHWQQPHQWQAPPQGHAPLEPQGPQQWQQPAPWQQPTHGQHPTQGQAPQPWPTWQPAPGAAAHHAPPSGAGWPPSHPQGAGAPPNPWAPPVAPWAPPGAPQAWAGPALAPTKPAMLPAALPLDGQVYATALRPLPKRVGRWFAAGTIALGCFGAGQLIMLALLMPALIEAISTIATGGAMSQDEVMRTVTDAIGSPLGMLGLNLSWAAMIPGAIVATSVYGKRSWGYVCSVAGRWRWGVAARSAIVIVPVFAVYIGLMLSLDDTVTWTWNPNWALVAVVLLTTPLQSAGEEFAFRGFLTQALGGWIRNPWVASMLTGALIGLAFGLAHMHASISATLQLALVGFTCSMLAFRTGGLEAACVLHAANNVFIMVPLALTGTSAISAQPVAGEDWLGFAMALAALGIAYVGVHFLLRNVQRTTVGAEGSAWLEPRHAPLPAAAPAMR